MQTRFSSEILHSSSHIYLSMFFHVFFLCVLHISLIFIRNILSWKCCVSIHWATALRIPCPLSLTMNVEHSHLSVHQYSISSEANIWFNPNSEYLLTPLRPAKFARDSRPRHACRYQRASLTPRARLADFLFPSWLDIPCHRIFESKLTEFIYV